MLAYYTLLMNSQRIVDLAIIPYKARLCMYTALYGVATELPSTNLFVSELIRFLTFVIILREFSRTLTIYKVENGVGRLRKYSHVNCLIRKFIIKVRFFIL